MKKMKNTVKGILVAGAILAMTATTALAMPYTNAGMVNDTSILRYTDMKVERNGAVSFTLHNNSGHDATFNGNLLFNSDEGTGAWTGLMSGVSVPANGSVRVSTSLAKGSYQDFANAGSLSWSGVRVEGAGQKAYPEVQWTVLN